MSFNNIFEFLKVKNQKKYGEKFKIWEKLKKKIFSQIIIFLSENFF